MGNLASVQTVTYENIQDIITAKSQHTIILNTLPSHKQDVLIPFTIDSVIEETTINDLIKSKLFDQIIIIYGQNAHDNTITKKYQQLYNIGFTRCYVYFGGVFEWLMLQDIYGSDTFPCSNNSHRCALDFKPTKANLHEFT